MPRTLSEDEMISILEEIARDGTNAAARIAAIRALRELEDGDSPQGGFEDLDRAFRSQIRTKTRA